MERRIEIKKQDERSFSPRKLVKRLSKVFGLKGPDSVIYQKGKDSQYGTLILRLESRGIEGGRCDIQEAYRIISSAGYTVVRFIIQKDSSSKGLEDVLAQNGGGW